MPPLNGFLGDCPSTLIPNSSCTPSCWDHYEVEGVTTCNSDLEVIFAVCNPIPVVLIHATAISLGLEIENFSEDDFKRWIVFDVLANPKTPSGLHFVDGIIEIISVGNGDLVNIDKFYPETPPHGLPAFGLPPGGFNDYVPGETDFLNEKDYGDYSSAYYSGSDSAYGEGDDSESYSYTCLNADGTSWGVENLEDVQQNVCYSVSILVKFKISFFHETLSNIGWLNKVFNGEQPEYDEATMRRKFFPPPFFTELTSFAPPAPPAPSSPPPTPPLPPYPPAPFPPPPAQVAVEATLQFIGYSAAEFDETFKAAFKIGLATYLRVSAEAITIKNITTEWIEVTMRRRKLLDYEYSDNHGHYYDDNVDDDDGVWTESAIIQFKVEIATMAETSTIESLLMTDSTKMMQVIDSSAWEVYGLSGFSRGGIVLPTSLTTLAPPPPPPSPPPAAPFPPRAARPAGRAAGRL